MGTPFGSFAAGINLSGLQDSTHNNHDHGKTLRPLSLLVNKDKEEYCPSPQETPLMKTKIDTVRRLCQTVAVYLVFLGCGASCGIVGPTLVHLEHIYKTDTSGISRVHIGSNIGYVLGTIMCALIFDKLNHELLFTFCGAILGLTLIFTPWMPGLYYYFVIVAIQYLSQGTIFAGGQSYIVKLWDGHRHKKPIVMACYMLWSLGSCTCPFLAIPFLDNLNDNRPEMTIYHNITLSLQANTSKTNYTINNDDNNMEYSSITKDNLNYGLFSGVYKVRYIFFIVGIENCLAAILFFILFLWNRLSCRPKDYHSKEAQNLKKGQYNNNTDDTTDLTLSEEKQPTIVINNHNFKHVIILKVAVVSIWWLQIFSYMWSEYIIGVFISVFAVKYLNWSIGQGALATAIFYGLLGIGRLTGIGTAKLLSPSKILLINMTLTAASILLLMFCRYSNIIVWIAVGTAGFSMATTVPASILWMSQHMPITGVLSGINMSGNAMSCLVSGYLVGYLFDRYTPMWVVYSSLGFSVFTVIVFVALLVISKYWRKLNKETE